MTARKILICTHDFLRGGTERIAIGLARHWADAGREVVFLTGTRAGGLVDTVDPRNRVVELSPPIPRSLTSRLRLGPAMARLLPGLAADLIFLPGNTQFPMAPALARAAPTMPIIAKLSNPITPHGPSVGLLTALIRRYAHCVSGVAAMNSGLAREASALLPDMAVKTLYDPAYFNHAAPNGHLPAHDGRLQVVWAGRFEAQKDAMLALDVAEKLRSRTEFALTLLGSGRDYARITREITRRGLGGSVFPPGHVAEIDPWLRNADALLITSRYEGGPAVAVEALAHGVPVVSTDCSHFLHDIMTIPEAGTIVPTRDPAALAEALVAIGQAPAPDPALLAGLVTHLDADICAAAYLAWFDEIVATCRTPNSD